jgi:hypothetical protein
MSRPQGASNIQLFEIRSCVATTATQDILHLSKQVNAVPLEQFKAILRHQKNFLKWIDTRHNELLEAKRQLDENGRGPKDAVYRKYRWYAEQQSLLEAINAFEAFYKNTFINLGIAIQSYVPPHRIKGSVDAKTLWAIPESASSSSLIFEHQLFHNLGNVDDVTSMLVDARRYQPGNLNNPLQRRVKALQAIFQIRHTLSHNQGHITQSDCAKFAALGYMAKHAQVLDPSKDHLGVVVRDLLAKEAGEFTEWILDKAAAYLSKRNQDAGLILQIHYKDEIERLVGTHSAITQLPWQ